MNEFTAPQPKTPLPKHIAIIMDGNGRWAKQQGKLRHAGHRAGVENLRPIIRATADLGVPYLTLYAFSTENWRRPSLEVQGLMSLLAEFLDHEVENLKKKMLGLITSVHLKVLIPIYQKKSPRQLLPPVIANELPYQSHLIMVVVKTSSLQSNKLLRVESSLKQLPRPSYQPTFQQMAFQTRTLSFAQAVNGAYQTF